MCTSVASRVHGTTGEPCSSVPWWLRMMCSTAAASSRREARRGPRSRGARGSSRAGSRPAACRASVMSMRQRVGRVGVELADVVQQRAGDRDVAVDPRERRARSRETRLRDASGSARAARGGRPGGSAWRPAPRGSAPTSRVPAPSTRVEQRAQVRVLDRRDQLAQVGLHLRRPGAAGRRAGRRGRTRPGGRPSARA